MRQTRSGPLTVISYRNNMQIRLAGLGGIDGWSRSWFGRPSLPPPHTHTQHTSISVPRPPPPPPPPPPRSSFYTLLTLTVNPSSFILLSVHCACPSLLYYFFPESTSASVDSLSINVWSTQSRRRPPPFTHTPPSVLRM